jgi:hypothetical protein
MPKPAAPALDVATLRFARYSSYASYLSGARAAYTTKTHILLPAGKFPRNGHYISKTGCGRTFSSLEVVDGNGKIEPLTDQVPTCSTCRAALAKARAAA